MLSFLRLKCYVSKIVIIVPAVVNQCSNLMLIIIRIKFIDVQKKKKMLLLIHKGCETGEVQLVNGGSYYGAVQVCIAGTWGSVCYGEWDSNDANVVCRQLGYESGYVCKFNKSCLSV